jgi:F0F1-type ATP synthase assembly protein I
MKRQKSLAALAGEYSNLAFALPVSCLIGYAIGYYLDRFFGTNFLYIVFLLLGIAAGFLQIYRQVTKEIKDEDGK